LQYTDLLAMVLALGIYWGRRELFLPSLAGFCLLLAFMKTKHISEYLIALAGAYLIQFKYVRIILIIVIFIFLVYDPYLAPHIWDWGKISGLIFLLIVHFTNKFYESFLLVISGALLIILTAQLGSDVNLIKSSQQFAYTSFTKISATSNRINPQIAPKTQNRPVLYVENCVAKSDNLSIRAGTSLEILFCYLEKTILPYPLAFYYGYRFIRPQNITESVPLLSFILYLLLLILAIIFSFRYSLISFGLFIYLFSIVVFSNYFTYIAGMMGDRFLLIPSLGWCIALAGVLYRFSNLRLNSKIEDWRNINPATKYFFMIVLLSYSVLTFSRNMDWKNDLSLFRKDIRYVNMSSQAHNLLALHLMQHAETEQDPTAKSELEHEALGHFKEALQIYPRFFNVAFDIGRVYMALNMPDSAINAFKYATTLDTLYPELYKNLGELYFSKQMYGEAATYYAHMITFSPSEYLYYGKLSYSYFLMKDYEKSLAVNKKALAVLPGLPDPYINTSRTYLGMNKTDSAVAYLKTANRLFPNNAEIQALLKQVGNK
jgi:cytochrome c-type biogenesis protein CcmH/NrfG